jgi:competence protein ComEA
VSFEAGSGPPLGAEPSRPGPGGGGALVERTRAWLRWIGPGRVASVTLLLVLVAAGGWWLLRTPPLPTEAGLPYAGATTTTSTSLAAAVSSPAADVTVPSVVVVHVAGAVARPGVYELSDGARVHDAVDAAGGPVRRADPDALNLAAPLTDGERIYVPRVGDGHSFDVDAAPDAATADPVGPVDVNHATVEQLDVLPGIGPATAAAIVDHRDQYGPFASVDDLEDVRGIGPAKLEAIRDLVTV